MSSTNITPREFAHLCYRLLRSDRDVVLGVGGFTGEGKTCFTYQILKEYAKESGTAFNMDRFTWSRAELLRWIDGEPGSNPGPDGLKKGQLPEYSAVLPDELFYMFYRRTWFEVGQIGAIATFNSCRDRHLLVAGNVPDFWDLDPGFQKRVRFYIYIPERGTAWVFQQENNPFSKDPWNVNENRGLFRKKRNPFKITNFVAVIKYPDWTSEERTAYYEIRNKKRISGINEVKRNIERYGDVREQRDLAIKAWYNDRRLLSKKLRGLNPKVKKELTNYNKPPSLKAMASILGLSSEAVRLTLVGRAPRKAKEQHNNIT
jgi:hypothetical protein